MTDTADTDHQSWYSTWLPRVAATTTVVLIFWFGGRWVFESTSEFILTLVLAVFIAFAMLPAVEYLTGRGWKRGSAAGVTMVAGVVIILVFLLAITNVLAQQVGDLIKDLPRMVDTAVIWVNDTFAVELDLDTLNFEMQDAANYVSGLGSDFVGVISGVTGSVVGVIFQALTIGLFVYYILSDWPSLRTTILHRLRPDQQEVADTVVEISIEKVGGWVYSRGALAALSAVYHFVVFLAIGLPYPLALALWVGVISQFIPSIGTYLAGAVPIAVALVSGDSLDALWVLIAITVYQQIENYLISPRITANTMDLHPAVAFGAAIVGGSLLGGLGAVLALPVAAALTAIADLYGTHHEVIESERFESPEAYEERMREVDEEKTRKKYEHRRRWLRPWKHTDSDHADSDVGSE
ncbi:MAG: AI-2E family transporter [Acidimicrobiia bacterium]|nr:AI-2E family transporter [Acidimicrobiia bacterium]